MSICRMLVFVALSVILATVDAGPGTCPDAQPMDNFDFKTYAQGRWFEIARYTQFSIEKGADCVFFDYAPQGKDMHCMLREIVDKKEKKIDVTVTPSPDAGTTAKLFYSALRQMDNVTVYILDTDYKNYSIFYYCSFDDAAQSMLELAWIKSRTPSLKPEVKAVVDQFIVDHPVLEPKKFQWDHFTREDCLMDV